MSVKIVWGLVAYGPFPYAEVYTSHMMALNFAARRFATEFLDGSNVRGIGASDRMYTHNAENACVEQFLAISDATHLFLTEMDLVLPVETIPALLTLDKPVASGLYFLRGGRGQACLYVKAITVGSNPYPHTPVSLFPTDEPFKLGVRGGNPGLGCVLIRRDVFEAIEPPWFDLKERNLKTDEGHGSDMYFFTKVRDAGFEVWVEPRVRCNHMDYVSVGFDDHLKRVQEDKTFGAQGFILAPNGLRHG